jgi:hypothetical protein
VGTGYPKTLSASGRPARDRDCRHRYVRPCSETGVSLQCVLFEFNFWRDLTVADTGLGCVESHICVAQTTIDLLANGHKVYVLADGVSSCNPQEVPIALDRLRREGAVVTTSESFLFECMGDANISE